MPFPTPWNPYAFAPGQVWRWSASMPALRGNLWKVRQQKFQKPTRRRGAGPIAINFVSCMIGLSWRRLHASNCTWLFHNGFKSIGIGKQKSTHDCGIQIWVRDSNMETIPEVCHVCMVGSHSAVEGSSSMSRYYSKSYCGMKIPQESQQLDRLFYQLKRLGCPKVGVLTLWNLEWCSQ